MSYSLTKPFIPEELLFGHHFIIRPTFGNIIFALLIKTTHTSIKLTYGYAFNSPPALCKVSQYFIAKHYNGKLTQS